ncbi:peptidyl-prolyl cis-trans isomerase FKBP8-like [Biomphalaria glabrata]|uniref:peptidylprolyl isomerase n=1 Tax=Biomphalaria glabrata TaxID=6526 RepID=A0A9W3ASH8_BIOGL|nr:peptidyl-prolyl cis-trans isomerase FKBP8-like [Biomphalaria glabrata]
METLTNVSLSETTQKAKETSVQEFNISKDIFETDIINDESNVLGEKQKIVESVHFSDIEDLSKEHLKDTPESPTVEDANTVISSDTSPKELKNKTDEDSNEDSDSMPDLIWPEKKSKVPTDLRSTLSSSTSQDTGFGSEDVGDTSPDEIPSKTDSLTSGSQDAVDSKLTTQTEDSEAEDSSVMDILGNGLLIKKILTAGYGIDTRPTNGDIVTLKVEGRREDGKLVDNEEITFYLNDGDVILAFDLAAALMEQGEKCELRTDAKYAYGSLGREPDIPKDSKLIYILELLHVQQAPELSSLSFEERLKIGESKRERGNYLFGRSDYTGAINSYNKAVKVLVDPELNAGLDKTSHSILVESSVKCYNNMAACQLKIDAFDAVIRSCEKVLASETNNVKALYRIGKAYGAKGEIEQAITFMRRAIKLDPESKMLNQEMLNLTRRKLKETKTEKELYQKMLGVKPTQNQPSDKKKTRNSKTFIKWTVAAGVVAAALVSVGVAFFRTS